MKRLISMVVLAIAAATAHAGCLTAPDDHGGRGLHLAGGSVLGLGIAAVWPDMPWYGQLALSQVPGVLKEAYDCHSYGLASRNDLKANLLGAIPAIALVRFSNGRGWVGLSPKAITVALQF